MGEQCPIKNTFWPQSSTPMSLQLKMRTSSSSKIQYSRRKTQMNKIIWEMCSLTMILVLINLLTKRNNNDFYIYIYHPTITTSPLPTTAQKCISSILLCSNLNLHSLFPCEMMRVLSTYFRVNSSFVLKGKPPSL